MTLARQSQSSKQTVYIFLLCCMLDTGICYIIIIINHSERKMKGFFPICLFDPGFGHFDPLAYPYGEYRAKPVETHYNS